MTEQVGKQDEDIPPFLRKKARKGSKAEISTQLGAELAELYLENTFLAAELEEAQKAAQANDNRASRLQQVAGGLQATLEQSTGYSKYLLKAVGGYAKELTDAYEQLGEVPQRLDQAWNRGYLARVKEEALRRIEARKRERENGFGRRAANLIRGRVTSLMTIIQPVVSSVGNRLRRIV